MSKFGRSVRLEEVPRKLTIPLQEGFLLSWTTDGKGVVHDRLLTFTYPKEEEVIR